MRSGIPVLFDFRRLHGKGGRTSLRHGAEEPVKARGDPLLKGKKETVRESSLGPIEGMFGKVARENGKGRQHSRIKEERDNLSRGKGHYCAGNKMVRKGLRAPGLWRLGRGTDPGKRISKGAWHELGLLKR